MIEEQPVEYDVASLNRSLLSLQRQLNKLSGLTYGATTQDAVDITVQFVAGTITFTVTTFDGTKKSGTVAIA